jgi:RNA-directed DNA polymerase
MDPKTILLQLQSAHSVQDVARALQLDPDKFFYVVKNCDTGIYYNQFRVPKKGIGHRDIAQPLRGLALAQDRFCLVLKYVYNPGQYVKAFVKGTSFVENAQYHQGQQWILNIDLQDFFPTVSFPRVRGVFMSRLFGFNPRVATILARVCTFQGVLPQGASTSPVLANIVAKPLDKLLLNLAKADQIKYSRYSDDITFSSSKRNIPASMVKTFRPQDHETQVTLGDSLKDAVRSSGFVINDRKTRLMLPNNRQEVTGLVVNMHANVRRRDISKLRMKIHTAKKTNLDQAGNFWLNCNGQKFKEHVVGWLSYIRQVKGSQDPVLAKLCRSAHEIGIDDIPWIKELAEMVREFDVFLSHASEDKDQMRKLKSGLESKGITVFFDEDSISWGDSIVEKVNHGLLRSNFFMPYLSQVFSDKGWTNKELNSAISMNISEKGRILPIKAYDFDLGDTYPILNDTLYKTWPEEVEKEAEFIEGICCLVLKKIESEKLHAN